MNETVRDYCQVAGIEFTCCRPYRKNDQVWVEQKNGAIVRRIFGYRRYGGLEAAAELARLYATVRLYINFVQPSFKLAGKRHERARVCKRYHPSATPAQRLLTDPRTSEDVRLRIEAWQATLDPDHLLSEMRSAQRRLVEIADQTVPPDLEASPAPTLEEFLNGLRTAWRSGEVRPTAQPKAAARRTRRRSAPFATASERLREWFEAELWRIGRELLERLQAENPGVYPDGQLQTLQRRLKIWRQETAHKMVFGALSGIDGAE